MENLQTRKAQLEKEIAETREYINSLGDTPQDDIRWEREMRYCSKLRTELMEINNKIAKAEKAAASEATVEAPVATNSIAKVAVSSVVAAHNAVMEEVAKIPGLKENATVRFYEDGTRVHFKDAYFRYDFTMVITERADGKINYRLEEQSTGPSGRRRRNKDLSSLASVMKFIAFAV